MIENPRTHFSRDWFTAHLRVAKTIRQSDGKDLDNLQVETTAKSAR